MREVPVMSATGWSQVMVALPVKSGVVGSPTSNESRPARRPSGVTVQGCGRARWSRQMAARSGPAGGAPRTTIAPTPSINAVPATPPIRMPHAVRRKGLRGLLSFPSGLIACAA